MNRSWWWLLDNKDPLVIWIVEDDAAVQRIVSDQLKKNGYNPVVYENAEKTYAALNKGALPALIILDILLPGMSGVDLIRLLKQNKIWEKIPIVVVSALSREQGLGAGSEDQTAFWINKPFDAGNLIQTIQNVLMSVGKEGKLS
jgi:DNA-binding response OmpR family regulator